MEIPKIRGFGLIRVEGLLETRTPDGPSMMSEPSSQMVLKFHHLLVDKPSEGCEVMAQADTQDQRYMKLLLSVQSNK